MPTQVPLPRVYLAGPDVFRPDAAQHLGALAQACAALGMDALRPFDSHLPATNPARTIYDENMRLLRSADGVIANLAPFRGTEPDSGTVFEVGVAIAQGLPVVAYGVPPRSYASRVQSTRDAHGVRRDPAGLAVEDFGLPLNLMLACSVTFASSKKEALEILAKLLRAAPRQ